MAKNVRSRSGPAPDYQRNSTCGPRPLHRLDSVPERPAHEGLARLQMQEDLPRVDEERRHLLGTFGSSVLLSIPGALAITDGTSAAARHQPERRATVAQPSAAAATDPLSFPLLRETYGATANGKDDDAQALAALPAGAGALVGPGTYRIGSDVEIKGHLWLMPGAKLQPAAGVTVTFAPGTSITAGDYQIFDDAQGGTFQGRNTVGWAKSSWFPGGSPRDLGAQINKAFEWWFISVDVPPAPDHEIRTTVRMRHSSTVRCMWNNFHHHVVCATNDKPVFEAIGGVRHWRIIGGLFDGAPVNTPSCFILCSWGETDPGQCGDTTALSETHVTGHWGHGVIANISAEVLVFQNCALWIQGRGDTSWTGPLALVIIGNADYWGLPFAYQRPNRHPASCSAIVFDNCDLRGGFDDVGSTFLLKGQVEDVTINATYLNSVGRCGILVEPGRDPAGAWTSPRRVYMGGGGRTETNKGTDWAGCPTIIVDGLNVGGALEDLTFGPIGHFIGGGQHNRTPIVKTENGGILHAFTMNQGGQISGTSRLLEHRTADLNWADVRCRFKVDIDCGTRALNDCDIKIGGRVVGAIGTGTKVRANNVQNW